MLMLYFEILVSFVAYVDINIQCIMYNFSIFNAIIYRKQEFLSHKNQLFTLSVKV